MRSKLLPLITMVTAANLANAGQPLVVGDGQIDGRKLQPFVQSWYQCALSDGEWQAQSALTEELTRSGDALLRHRQTVSGPGGTIQISDTYYDRRTFSPQRMELEVTRDGVRLAHAYRAVTTDGYTGTMVRGEETQELSGSITSDMLNGAALGLPLATLGYQKQPLEFMASMMSFDGTYNVTAEWVGKETLTFDGENVEAWLIDVEWHHRESGDIYPPGPDASGGRYWVVNDPPDGFPYVPRYQTDTYNVEFVRNTCPE